MKIYLAMLFGLFVFQSTAQTINPTPTKFSNGIIVPTGVSAPIIGNGSLWYNSTKISYYNGSVWQYIASEGWVQSGYAPLTRTITINGQTFDLSQNRSWTISDGGVSSFNSREGAITPIETDYSSFYPVLSGSYINPSWISSLFWSKITNKPTTLSGYGITDAYSSSNPNGYISSSTASSTYLAKSGGTLTGGLTGTSSAWSTLVTSASVSSTGNFILSGAAGTNRDFVIQTNGGNRWSDRITSDPESGSNAGSNYQKIRRDDAGNFLGFAIIINRATGLTTLENLAVTSNITGNSFVKTGGTSDQILLANGGVSSLSALVASGNLSSAATLSVDVTKEVQIFSGTIATWTLPVITGNTWKKLYIKNRGSGILVVNANGGTNTIYTTSAVSTFSLNPGESVILVNDSTYWSLF